MWKCETPFVRVKVRKTCIYEMDMAARWGERSRESAREAGPSMRERRLGLLRRESAEPRQG